MTIDADALRTGLSRERDELRAAIDQAQRSLADGGDDEMARAGLALQESQLRKVEHALQRHEDGTWRECEECGEPVTDQQIKVLPTATRCEECSKDEAYWGDTRTIRREDLGLE